MKEKNEWPDQKKTRRKKKKKNKTAKDCRCICLLTYKFNTIKNLGFFYIVLRRRFFCNNITYNITAFFDSYKENKRKINGVPKCFNLIP